jgi:formylglycine-generating enzyme required for sulfatase activity
MKKNILLILALAIAPFHYGCDTGVKNVKKEQDPAAAQTAGATQKAAAMGTVLQIPAGTSQITMIQGYDKPLKRAEYVPYSEIENGVYVDKNVEPLNQPFIIAETELTNELALMVLQWAKNTGKLSDNPKAHNAVDTKWVKYGGEYIIDLAEKEGDFSYSPQKGVFSLKPGKEKYPFTHVNWYGAVMICNWLTEMTDGNTNELVYSGIGEKFDYKKLNKPDLKKKGFRLPEFGEYIFASRCVGSKKPTRGSLAKEYIAANVNGGMNLLIQGLYWLPGRYVSGAYEPYTNAAESLRVAVPRSKTPQPVATKQKNALGLYDIGGNVDEWMIDCDYLFGHNFRELDGGTDQERLQSGHRDHQVGVNRSRLIGMRLAKTR